MTNQHPITPTPELVDKWASETPANERFYTHIATQAAQWGADQQLQACMSWLTRSGYGQATADWLRAAVGPKPPTLKERIAAAIAAGDECTALSLLNEALPNG